VLQVEAAALDLSGAAAMDDGGDVPEAYPSAPSVMSDDGNDVEDTEASE